MKSVFLCSRLSFDCIRAALNFESAERDEVHSWGKWSKTTGVEERKEGRWRQARSTYTHMRTYLFSSLPSFSLLLIDCSPSLFPIDSFLLFSLYSSLLPPCPSHRVGWSSLFCSFNPHQLNWHKQMWKQTTKIINHRGVEHSGTFASCQCVCCWCCRW